MINLQQATYIHPNKEVLFVELNLTVNKQQKIALIGNNGIGKSTLLKIISGQLKLNAGQLFCASTPYYIPQILDSYNRFSVAQALGISKKLKALHQILAGQVTQDNLDTLNDDWTLEDRIKKAMEDFDLGTIDLAQEIGTLSGGQKTKVFLAGILIQEPEIILMDEPSNHLDHQGRALLYDFVEKTNKTLVIVSHDRKLLNQLSTTVELTKKGLTIYGGSYNFYQQQKSITKQALDQELQHNQKELNKAKNVQRDSIERQAKLNARGKRKQEQAGVPKIMMNILKNKAQGTSSKIKSVHQDKITGIKNNLTTLRNDLAELDQIKFNFEESNLHQGKILLEACHLNYQINSKFLWKDPLNFKIKHGDRVAIKGLNGSGKTTLLKMLLGEITPTQGKIISSQMNSLYVDQEYSLLQADLSVYEMAQSFNDTGLQEHEVKIRLDRFLFKKDRWDQPCYLLSGGERMRLLICVLTILNKAPDLIILDEPTNNIDLQNITILTNAINNFHGTLLIVSHDEQFLQEIHIQNTIDL